MLMFTLSNRSQRKPRADVHKFAAHPEETLDVTRLLNYPASAAAKHAHIEEPWYNPFKKKKR